MVSVGAVVVVVIADVVMIVIVVVETAMDGWTTGVSDKNIHWKMRQME